MQAIMFSFRKFMWKPKVDDWSPLAKFYYADEQLNTVSAELDSFDGRKDPERCAQLVNKLRSYQDKVLKIIDEMLQENFPNETDRAPRDYRVKFPDDILHDSLPGQLWFGAECLAAGSNIIDHEFESEAIRPLAKNLTAHLDNLRHLLKDQCLRNPSAYPEKLMKSLRTFDHLFAEFELNYVSAMVPVKSIKEYDVQLDVAVLFSETLMRAVKKGYITQEQLDDCDPTVMITVPRLAIICGLLIYPDGPLMVDRKPRALPEMFRPFHSLLKKIRDLLRTLSAEELAVLERALCNQEEPQFDPKQVTLISEYRTSKVAQKQQSASAGNSDALEAKDSSAIDIPLGKNDDGEFSPASANSPVIEIDLPSDSSSQSIVEIDTPETVLPTMRKQERGASEETIKTDEFDENSPRKSNHQSDRRISVHNENNDVEISGTGVKKRGSAAELVLPGGLNSNDKNRSSSDETSKRELRQHFRGVDDLIHRLFVCVAGVADQLQSNYPADLRAVLRMVFQPQETMEVFEVRGRPARNDGNEEEVGLEVNEDGADSSAPPAAQEETGCGPVGVPWVPDSECLNCLACGAPFTLVRRRHHCRNCGQIFCGRCSANFRPLPELNYTKPVRVCNQCFLFKLNPFTNSSSANSTSRQNIQAIRSGAEPPSSASSSSVA